MHKDELIQMHTLLCQIKNDYEARLANLPIEDKEKFLKQYPRGFFVEYGDFGVSPQHIHKSKMQHKRACFILGKELAQYVGSASNGKNRVMQRLGDLAARTGAEAMRKHFAREIETMEGPVEVNMVGQTNGASHANGQDKDYGKKNPLAPY